MNVFDLAAKLYLDKKEYDEGLDKSEDKGKSWVSNMGSMFSNAGSMISKALATAAKVGVVAITAASTAAGALVSQAVFEYANYEQLVGGVETLFGSSYQTIEEYAEGVGVSVDTASDAFEQYQARQETVLKNADNAYKTAGLSANAYMETVTSFAAALNSSLGENAWQSANYADQAITDMSDNANKMGSSMESIQTAYMGFSKQNYTMLDNLKLGYGGTKEEMERLLRDAEELEGLEIGSYDVSNFADIVSAIHAVQENLGITGTTAKEAASTINGSMAMVKASWKNVLTAIASDNEQLDASEKINEFVESVGIAADNIIPRVEIAIQGVGQLINELLPSIVAEIPVICNDVLPDLISAGASMVGALVEGLITNGPSIVEGIAEVAAEIGQAFLTGLPDMMNTGMSMFSSLLDGLANGLPKVLSFATEVIVDIVQGLTNNLPKIVSSAANVIQSLASGLSNSIPQIIPVAMNAVFTFAESLLDNSDKIISAALELIMSLAEGLMQALPKLIEKAPVLINQLISAILRNLPQIVNTGARLVAELIGGIVASIPSLIVAAGELVVMLVKTIASGVESFVDCGFQLVAGLWQGIQNSWGNLVSNVKNLGKNLVNGLKDILGIHSPSRVFAEIGEYCVSGFEEGIEDLANCTTLKNATAQMSKLDGFTAQINTTSESSDTPNDVIAMLLEEIKELLKNLKIVLDTDVLVGQTVEKYDKALGELAASEGRSV